MKTNILLFFGLAVSAVSCSDGPGSNRGRTYGGYVPGRSVMTAPNDSRFNLRHEGASSESAKFVGSSGMISQFEFVARGTSGKSLNDYNGDFQMTGSIIFSRVFSESQHLASVYPSPASSQARYNRCPSVNVPLRFSCPARISIRNFQCDAQINGSNYHIRGSLVNSNTTTHRYDVITVAVYGECAMRSAGGQFPFRI